jgi:signal transduction histidine kinase/CheY-like chemotaxis protein
VGTLAGLYREERGALVPETRPRIDRPVYLAFEDGAGDAWFGTDHGVYRWDGTDLRHYTVRDGLAGQEVNRAAGLAAPDGGVWIGTSRGLSVYRRDLDVPRPRGPVVELTSLDVDGNVMPAGDGAELVADGGTLLFHFRAISFIDEEGVRFRTRLEGFDADWSGPGPLPQRTVRYTNVPPGAYRMHVQAIDVAGAESAVASSGPIVIRPPLLQRPAVRAAAGAAAIGVAIVVLALIAQRRQSRRLERVVRERTDELRRTERDLAKAQRLEALGVLAGGIAHDFNNLLQVMVGGAALLEADTRIPADRRQVAHEVKIAGRHARDLTQQLLTFSRGGAPVRRSTELAGVIRSAAGIALAGGSVRAEIDAAAPLFVEADESQIYQVIHNLLINACQAMPEGGSVRVRARPEAGGSVLLEVEDDGPGIPPGSLESIFDPFYSTKPGGTGLGLAVAHSIVTRHGGEISAASEPGRGATFRVRLPAGPPPAATEAPPAAGAGSCAAPGGGAAVSSGAAPGPAARGSGRVLIMDDDPAVRRSLGRMLSELGYRAWTARNGEEAVSLYREALARREGFDAVLMDLRVADGTGGRDAVRALAALDPGVRAIVVSGYSDDAAMARHRELGFRACLPKPFTPDDLARALDEAAAPARTAAG